MKKQNFTFILILIIATLLLVGLTIAIEVYKEKFMFSDFGNIASILQGTIGVSISLAGAIVAIRLANLSIMIIEREKKREDSKFFHEIINEAILPIKKLTNSFQDLHFNSRRYEQLINISDKNLKTMDPEILDFELQKMKIEVAGSLEKIIIAIKELSESQYAYSFWLYLTGKRLKNKSLLVTGGGARDSVDKNNRRSSQWENQKGVTFMIEDLNFLHNSLSRVYERFLNTNLNMSDLKIAREILENGTKNIMDHTLSINFGKPNMVVLSLFSLYYRSSYFNQIFKSRNDEGIFFENKMLLLFIDIYHNLPDKNDLIGFASTLFSEDEISIISNSPVTNSFDILNDAYWFGFDVIYEICHIDLIEYKRKEDGTILGSNEFGRIWIKWQSEKIGLYPAYTKDWIN